MEGKHIIITLITIGGMIYSIYDQFFAPDDLPIKEDTSDICEAFKDEEIRLYYRGLDTLPHNLSVMQCIRKMNLSNNRFTDLPDLSAFPSITEVNLSYNQITKLPSLQNNPRIKLLDLSYNQISSISAE